MLSRDVMRLDLGQVDLGQVDLGQAASAAAPRFYEPAIPLLLPPPPRPSSSLFKVSQYVSVCFPAYPPEPAVPFRVFTG